MKKDKITKKVLFILFFIVILIINLLLPKLLNYDNIIAGEKYDQAIENGTEPEMSYAQMEDNKTKVGENFDNFLSNARILIFVVSFLFFVFFLIFDIKKISIQKLFLIIAIPLGILYIALIPIGGIPDENTHWYKSYEVSEGYLVSDRNEENIGGRVLPSAIQGVLTDDNLIPAKTSAEEGIRISYDQWIANYNKAMSEDTGEEEFIQFSNTALYCSIVYIPQALGIIIARAFSGSYLVQAYFARGMNFLLFIIIMSYAIKKIPFKKLAIFAIAFLPITIQEAVSLSIDGIQIAFATLLISYTLYLTYTKDKISVKDYIILFVSCIITAITKFVYLPLCLIIFIIPKDKFKNTKTKYISLIVMFLITAILDLALILHSLHYENTIASVNSDMIEQLKYIIKNPLDFIYVIILTIQKFGLEHTLDMFGQGLAWDDVSISPIYIVSLFVITMYFIYFRSSKNDEIESINECVENRELMKIVKQKFLKDKNQTINEDTKKILECKIEDKVEGKIENKDKDSDKGKVEYIVESKVESKFEDKIEDKKEIIEIKKIKIQNIITKIFLIIIALGTTFGIVFTEYLTICAVGADYISGIQSRYYIPLLLLYGIVFTKKLNKEKQVVGMEYLAMFMVFANLNALVNIMFRFI